MHCSDEGEDSSAEESVGSNLPVKGMRGGEGGPLRSEMLPAPAVKVAPRERRRQ